MRSDNYNNFKYNNYVAGLIILYFVVAFVFFIYQNFDFLFALNILEHGNVAVNALDVRDAVTFHEIYGNYSRWNFQHPGPVFFYVFAAAEFMFYDVFHLTSSPVGAHLIASTLLQMLFSGFGLWVIARYVLNLSATPVLLAIFLIHFSLAVSNYTPTVLASVWPSMLLVGPTICFISTLTAISLGYRALHIVMGCIISASFLIHGHVAQVMFVMPGLIFALLIIHRSGQEGLKDFFHSKNIRTGFMMAVIFALPIIIDLTRLGDSNLLKYFKYLAGPIQDGGEKHPFTYIMSFAVYNSNIKETLESGVAIVDIIKERWYILAFLSFLMIAILTGWFLGRWRKDKQLSQGVTMLSRFVGLYIFLSLVWASIINGGYDAFNAFYFLSVLYLVWVVLIVCFLNIYQNSGLCENILGPL